MDVALYRAVSSLRAAVAAVFEQDGSRFAEVRMPRSADTVYRAEVNGVPSGHVELLSDKVAHVEIPPQFSAYPTGDLSVTLWADASLSETETTPLPASIGFGARTGLYSAEMQALQRASRSLLMGRGTDTWDPSRGGDLLSLKGRLMNATSLTSIVREVQRAVDSYNANVGSRRQRSSRRPAPAYSVVRIELQSVRVLSTAEAQATLRGRFPDGQTQPTPSSSEDVTLLINLMHDLRGPDGAVRKVSSSMVV